MIARYVMHGEGSLGDRGLSWKRLRADETGDFECKEAEDEQTGQDTRNLWHQTQVREQNKHMLCVHFILKLNPYVT